MYIYIRLRSDGFAGPDYFTGPAWLPRYVCIYISVYIHIDFYWFRYIDLFIYFYLYIISALQRRGGTRLLYRASLAPKVCVCVCVCVYIIYLDMFIYHSVFILMYVYIYTFALRWFCWARLLYGPSVASQVCLYIYISVYIHIVFLFF